MSEEKERAKECFARGDRDGLARALGLDDLIRYHMTDEITFVPIYEAHSAFLFRVDIAGRPAFVEKYVAKAKARAARDFSEFVASATGDGFVRLHKGILGDTHGVLSYEYLEQLTDVSLDFAGKAVDAVAALNSVAPDDPGLPPDIVRRYDYSRNGNYHTRRFLKADDHLAEMRAHVLQAEIAEAVPTADRMGWFLDRLPQIRQKILAMPLRAAHGDVHVMNWMRKGDRILIVDADEWGFLPLGVDMARIIFPAVLREHGFFVAEELISRYHARLRTDMSAEDVLFSVWAHVVIINMHDVAYRKRIAGAVLIGEVIDHFRALFGDRFDPPHL